MPLPHWLTRVNLVTTNRVTSLVAGSLPWFGLLEHIGRRSGVARQTPLNVFRRDRDRWVIALTYGADVQWLRNVEAAGRCRMLVLGRWIVLVEPRLVHDPRRLLVPLPVRWMLGLLGVDDFVVLREERLEAGSERA